MPPRTIAVLTECSMTKLLKRLPIVGISLPVLIVGFAVQGCGGTMAFEGKKAIAVTGSEPIPAPKPAPKPQPEKKKKAEVKKNKIVIDEKVQFEHDKAVILKSSFELLGDVAAIMKENPQIKKVLVEGHASSEGDAKHNLQLSDERAKSVMNYLVSQGVDKSRLSAKGFGSSEPVADNANEEGREKNRRVEFTIEGTDEKGAAK
jgi:outer membrane protein OmpA-like peptidoglycan-associated protein